MVAIHPFFAFFIALGLSFGSAIPFGPINLSVIDTTIRNNLKCGVLFSLAAALVEIVQVMVALFCSVWVAEFFTKSPAIKVGAFVLFIILGFVFLFKGKVEKKKVEPGSSSQVANFFKGALIALANPQTLPFWIFVLTYLETVQMIPINASQPWSIIIAFGVGVCVGKFLGLLGFSLLSHKIGKKSTKITKVTNKAIGYFLIVIGVIQGIQAFFM
jgi:L-lysine exporter family protein LysE/ArgO